MKKLFSILAVSIMLGLTACGESGQQSSDTVKVGLNFELSGGVASYGQAISKGVKLALNQANENGGVIGKDIQIIEYDNKSEQAEVSSVYLKLATQDKVSVVLGPATSGNTKTAVPNSTKYKVPMVSCSATDDSALFDASGKVVPYAFKTCFNDSYQGSAMASYAYETLGLRKAVIFGDSSSDYAKGLANAFKEEFTSLGGVIISEESYVEKDKDFNSVVTKLKGLDFDCLYIPGYYSEVGLIIKQFREAGCDQYVLGGDGFESEVLTELAGAENLNKVCYTNHYSTVSPSEEMVKFINDFKNEYGEVPNTFSALGYDLGKYIVQVINDCGSQDPEAITKAIADTKEFVGVTGTFSMGEDHAPVKGCYIVTLENGVASKAEQYKAK